MKSRYYFMVTVLAAGGCTWQALEHTHHAADLAKAITTKDQASLDTASDQSTLAAYTAKHMATGRTVILKASYDRAAAAAMAAANPQSNGAVYAAAQTACAGHGDSISQASCVQSYVAAHTTAGANPQAAILPKLADYTKHFSAPVFTTDTVGIALLVALASAVGGVSALMQRHRF